MLLLLGATGATPGTRRVCPAVLQQGCRGPPGASVAAEPRRGCDVPKRDTEAAAGALATGAQSEQGAVSRGVSRAGSWRGHGWSARAAA
eukprot:9400070-Alexandrium_andersonii.AAC.1